MLPPPPTEKYPQKDLPILQKLREAYKLWHSYLGHLPRLSRYSLGIKIDNLFTDTLELTLLASYAERSQKLGMLQKAGSKLDSLKFFLQISWELKILDNKKYAIVSVPLAEVGKMIGGWIKQLSTPPHP